MRWEFLITFIFLIMSYPVYASISCSVTDSCNRYTVLKMLQTNTSHAQLRNETGYNFSVCCIDDSGALGSACTGAFARIINLSKSSNSHAGYWNESAHQIGVCLSTTSQTITSSYQLNNCSGYDTCAFSIKNNSNSHIGNCTAYPRKVCLTAIPKPAQSVGTGEGGGISCKQENSSCSIDNDCCGSLLCSESVCTNPEKLIIQNKTKEILDDRINFSLSPLEQTLESLPAEKLKFFLIIRNTGLEPLNPVNGLSCIDISNIDISNIKCPKLWCSVSQLNETLLPAQAKLIEGECDIPDARLGDIYNLIVCTRASGLEKCSLIRLSYIESFNIIKITKQVELTIKGIFGYPIVCIGTDRALKNECYINIKDKLAIFGNQEINQTGKSNIDFQVAGKSNMGIGFNIVVLDAVLIALLLFIIVAIYYTYKILPIILTAIFIIFFLLKLFLGIN